MVQIFCQLCFGIDRNAATSFENLHAVICLRDSKANRTPLVRIRGIGQQKFKNVAQQSSAAIDRAIPLRRNLELEADAAIGSSVYGFSA